MTQTRRKRADAEIAATRPADAQQFLDQRRMLGMNQRTLAAKLGLSTRQISAYECGEDRVPQTVKLAMQWLSYVANGP